MSTEVIGGDLDTAKAQTKQPQTSSYDEMKQRALDHMSGYTAVTYALLAIAEAIREKK